MKSLAATQGETPSLGITVATFPLLYWTGNSALVLAYSVAMGGGNIEWVDALEDAGRSHSPGARQISYEY